MIRFCKHFFILVLNGMMDVSLHVYFEGRWFDDAQCMLSKLPSINHKYDFKVPASRTF